MCTCGSKNFMPLILSSSAGKFVSGCRSFSAILLQHIDDPVYKFYKSKVICTNQFVTSIFLQAYPSLTAPIQFVISMNHPASIILWRRDNHWHSKPKQRLLFLLHQLSDKFVECLENFFHQ